MTGTLMSGAMWYFFSLLDQCRGEFPWTYCTVEIVAGGGRNQAQLRLRLFPNQRTRPSRLLSPLIEKYTTVRPSLQKHQGSLTIKLESLERADVIIRHLSVAKEHWFHHLLLFGLLGFIPS